MRLRSGVHCQASGSSNGMSSSGRRDLASLRFNSRSPTRRGSLRLNPLDQLRRRLFVRPRATSWPQGTGEVADGVAEVLDMLVAGRQARKVAEVEVGVANSSASAGWFSRSGRDAAPSRFRRLCARPGPPLTYRTTSSTHPPWRRYGVVRRGAEGLVAGSPVSVW